MTIHDKEAIRQALSRYVSQYPSQRAAAGTLKDISEATVVQITKGNWEQISAAMWRTVGKQVGWQQRQQALVPTKVYGEIYHYLATAQEHGESMFVVGPEGLGKTATAQEYTRTKPNAYYLECASYWNKKYFLLELLRAMGRDGGGMNVYQLMDEALRYLRQQDRPLIILDEVDKLKDEVLQFFITLYNKLHGICGIVWLSTDAIVKRMSGGFTANKSGFREIYSRLGRRPIELPRHGASCLRKVIQSVGITEEEEVHRIINTCEGDLRRIMREYLRAIIEGKKPSS